MRRVKSVNLALLIFLVFSAVNSTFASIILIEDFQNYTLGSLVQQSWWSGSTAAAVEQEAGNPTNQVLKFFLESGQHDLYHPLAPSQAVGQTETKTFFFRFRCSNASVNTAVGLTNVSAPSGWDDYRVQIQINDGHLGVRHGDQALLIEPLNMGIDAEVAWYNVWVVVDNASNTYKVYMVQNNDSNVIATEGDRVASGAVDTFDFRQPTGSSLNRLYLRANASSSLWIDHFYMISGEYLSHPFEVPMKAYSPNPRHNAHLEGETIFSVIDLMWNVGREAKAVDGQDVYVGAVPYDVANATVCDQTGIYRGRQSDALYTLPTSQLAANTYYYWRVDQVNEDNSITTGDLWQFYIEPRNPDINQDGIVDLNDFVIVADAWLETSETEPMLADLTGDGKVWLADFAYLANFWGFYDGPAPRQVFLTWQGDTATTMTISWRTDAPNPQAAILRYSDDPEAPLETYTVEVAEPFTFAPSNAVVHAVELTGLSPATEYHVVVGHPSNADTFKFRTAPDTSEEIVFLTASDVHAEQNVAASHALYDMAAAQNPDFIMFAGDYVGGYGGSESNWDHLFDDWHERLITADGRRIPVMTAIGNHDSEVYYNGSKATAPYYYNRFHLPGAESYYALTYGPDLLLVTLDSAHTTPITSQNQWLSNTLSQNSHYPWKIVQYHVAAYPSFRDFTGWPASEIRQHWVPLFEQYGVDIVVEGHDHGYKLTHPIKNGQAVGPDDGGVIYIGDGPWGGALRVPNNANDHWWLKETASIRHFRKITVSADGSQLHVEPIFIGNPGSGIGVPFVLEKE